MSETIAILETSKGTIKARLFKDAAPKTVENFRSHIENGYYDGIRFHRVIKDFMIQGGDPTGTGRGGESIWGKPFEDECVAEKTFEQPGILAMANAGPNTNGSQFFITTAATPWLHMRHTIFGEVIEGMDTVRAIEAVDTDRADLPLEPVEIKSTAIQA